MPRARLCLAMLTVLGALASAHGQNNDWSRILFNVGGGIGFPQGQLGSFVNNGGNFVIGAGYNVSRHIGIDSEFMWHGLPINDATKATLQTPGASARQYAWTFNPIFHLPLDQNLGAYATGGIGWYHRSGETTTPGLGVICDPYWSWWFGCTIGTVNIVTSSHSANSFGENIGGGLTFRIRDTHIKLYAEVRYHHAGYSRVPTNLLPLTFGVRW